MKKIFKIFEEDYGWCLSSIDDDLEDDENMCINIGLDYNYYKEIAQYFGAVDMYGYGNYNFEKEEDCNSCLEFLNHFINIDLIGKTLKDYSNRELLNELINRENDN